MFRTLEIVAACALAGVIGWSGPVQDEDPAQDDVVVQEPPLEGGAMRIEDSAPPSPPPQSQGERPGHGQGEGERRFDRGGGGFHLTPEMREHVLAVIADLRPLSDEERERLRAMSEDEFRKAVTEQGGMILGFARLRQLQPELYDLRIMDLRLLRQIREHLEAAQSARDSGQTEAMDAARAELRAAIAEQIDLRFNIREREIKALEDRVAEMREELNQEREMPREELVEKRLEMLESGEGEWWRDGRREGDSREQQPQPVRPDDGG